MLAWDGVEMLLQRRAYRHGDDRAGLGLFQMQDTVLDVRPGQTNDVALTLTGPQSEHQRQLHVRRRGRHEGADLVIAPGIGARRVTVELVDAGGSVDVDEAATAAPRQQDLEHRDCIIGLAGRIGVAVAPGEDLAGEVPRLDLLEGPSAKSLLNLVEPTTIVRLGGLTQPGKIGRRLVAGD